MEDTPIRTPAGYAPAFAIGQRDAAGRFAIVGDDAPLPVTTRPAAAGDTIEGSATTDGTVGPFLPGSGLPVFITLSGEWTGSAQLLRSTDAGTTMHPVTVAGGPWGSFTSNACEPIWQETEAGVQLYLDVEVTSGTMDWRIAQ